jgi:hypothetical protein
MRVFVKYWDDARWSESVYPLESAQWDFLNADQLHGFKTLKVNYRDGTWVKYKVTA